MVREKVGVGVGLCCKVLEVSRSGYYSWPSRPPSVRERGIKTSMSRKGNCYDNAFAESSFATLKKELIHRHRFKTRDEARQAIFEYIEAWYNRQRLHSSIGYMSPIQFEESLAA